jgi:hypothetical protein
MSAMPKQPIIAAYYFPNYHVDPRNEQWHGKGWTEWELVKAALPRFPGHQQPIVPAWGHFDESDPKWAAREIDLAADHGVNTFIYDWYYYEDGPYLQHGLDNGFLRAPNRDRMNFALMWANHNWTDIHPCKFRNKPEVLAPGRVGPEGFDRICDVLVNQYFNQPNHLKIDGKPYFSIYELGTFISGMGGVDAAAAALDRLRAKARAAGLPGVHVCAVVWQLAILPGELKVENIGEVLLKLGIESADSYVWIHHYRTDNSNFPHDSFEKAGEVNYGVWEHYSKTLPVPYHPNVTRGWDSSPRTVQTDRFENRGYPYMAILEGNTPERYKAALLRAKEFITRLPEHHQMITLNAWNEWTEGSYLLPDTVTGTAYLEAIRDVFGATPRK